MRPGRAAPRGGARRRLALRFAREPQPNASPAARAAHEDHRPEDTIEIAWALLLWAGFTATLTVSGLAAAARRTRLTRLDPARLLGSSLTGGRESPPARILGSALHFLLGSALFPAAYAAFFAWAGRANLLFGLLAGGVHGALAGLLLATLRAPARDAGAARRPGLFGHRLGPLTPLALYLAHLLYGLLLGYVYALPAG